MYLVELGSDGLVKVDGPNDGVRAIKEFRDILNDKKLGIECFTCIALVVDHLTSIRYYTDKDRPKKAMGIVMSNRSAFVWNQNKIQAALNKYDELQYNPVLEQKQLLMQMQMDKLNEIKVEKDNEKKVNLFKQLNTIKELINNFNKEYSDIDPYAEGPVKNGYSLSRLEEKLDDKSSFYHTRKIRIQKKKKKNKVS